MAGKRIAILQSNYIPWKGYFDIINSVDEFIFFDDVQYTRRDWRNRNLIKIQNGLHWLTIPVSVKSKFTIAINEVTVADQLWRKKHWETIVNSYRKAPHFPAYKDLFESLFLEGKETYLSQINEAFILAINDILGVKTKLSRSSDYQAYGTKNERLVSLCLAAGADQYLSGPSARNYLNEEMFNTNNISVSWMNYDNYPSYDQLYPPFEHKVSILDLIFCAGKESVFYMKSFNKS